MIYELCGADLQKSSIADYLQTAFSLDETPQNQVEQCLESLMTEGLIELCKT